MTVSSGKQPVILEVFSVFPMFFRDLSEINDLAETAETVGRDLSFVSIVCGNSCCGIAKWADFVLI